MSRRLQAGSVDVGYSAQVSGDSGEIVSEINSLTPEAWSSTMADALASDDVYNGTVSGVTVALEAGTRVVPSQPSPDDGGGELPDPDVQDEDQDSDWLLYLAVVCVILGGVAVLYAGAQARASRDVHVRESRDFGPDPLVELGVLQDGRVGNVNGHGDTPQPDAARRSSGI